MMNNYRFSNALTYSLEQLSEMHNSSFSGYFVPITMTPEMTADFWRTHQIDAIRSVVMHDQSDTFVGMARMGTRGQRGWCGGFGIVPAFRGSGASKLLAAQMVQVARETGLETLQLEVLSQNIRAHKLYEKAGFTTGRKLIGIEATTAALSNDTHILTERVKPEALLPLLLKVDQPCWGREPATILTADTEAIITTGPDGLINGLVLQRSGSKIRIQAALFQSQLAHDELAALLRAAAGDATGIQVYNEPEDSPFLTACLELGFTEFFSQYEMFIKF